MALDIEESLLYRAVIIPPSEICFGVPCLRE
jgi:hypothetical protein